ncbi:hypothetical protein EJB05_50824, partial [Eragrostis curvula]
MVALTLFTIHVLCVCLKQKHKRSNASLPLPPGPIKLPIIGNALHFIGPFGRSPNHVLARLAATYGPVMSFRAGTAGNFVVVSSPDAAHEALVANDEALAARLVPDAASAMAHGSTSMLFLPTSDAMWKKHRATIAAHISSGQSLDRTRAMRDRHARQLAEHCRASSGRPVAIGEAVFGTVLNIVSNILFSDNVVDMRSQAGQQPFRFRNLVAAVIKGWTIPNSAARNDDLLDVLLERHAKSELTRSEITVFFTDIFIAASNTSRIAVEWAMALLLKHPDKMKKVSIELAASLGSKEFVEDSDLNKIPYLHAVVKETLRMQPPAPLIPRIVVMDGVSLGGFRVPVGTCVLVNLLSIGRDPKVWPDPEEFKPERFLGAQEFDFRGSNFAYMPFGAGRRMCPGVNFTARLEPLVLASILHKIDWSLPGCMATDDIDQLRVRYSVMLELDTPLLAVP